MSVYSGFGTRQQETMYNKLLESLLISLKYVAMMHLEGRSVDRDKLAAQISTIYKAMSRLEDHKYHPPKYSDCVKDLHRLLKPGSNPNSRLNNKRRSTPLLKRHEESYPKLPFRQESSPGLKPKMKRVTPVNSLRKERASEEKLASKRNFKKNIRRKSPL